ncbi:hypothetical protein [uncultured Anaerococcus sp.]|uniref:type II toxin-antitoxin system HicB family antitoxin n=1 Tax=uncultured Anaerococcus sp. TaxID=293428 RepID=UPI00288C36BE|nr:hypothetical protein [uncultured Anaerococcus sp.]
MRRVKAYPVYFIKNDTGYTVFNEAIGMVSEGRDLEDAIYSSKDAIELLAYDFLIDGRDFPEPENCLGTDEKYDFINYVVCDLERYFRLDNDNKVKKNCTIPESLAKAGESRGLNFSKILTYALEKELNLA